jgi:hypothetical protein
MQRGNREGKDWGIGIKLFIFIFLELLFYLWRKCNNQESESP